MNSQDILGGVIALVLFAAGTYLVFRWLRVLIITYRLSKRAIRISIFGLPLFRIPYRYIRSAEIVRARQLWTLRSFLLFPLWLHTRLFVDGIVIKSRWRRYVLTPECPDEFIRTLRECQRANELPRANQSTDDNKRT